MFRRWIFVAAAAVLYLITDSATTGLTGLTRGIVSNADHRTLETGAVRVVDLTGIGAPAADSPGYTAEWSGLWLVTGGVYDILLDSNTGSTWAIDDAQIAQSLGDPVRRTIELAPGFHTILIRYDVDPRTPRLTVAAAPTGQRLRPLAEAELKPRLPRRPGLRAATSAARAAFGWLALGGLVWALRGTLRPVIERWSRRRPAPPAVNASSSRPFTWSRIAAWSMLALILLYGALLRLDAITERYGDVSSPGWVRALQTRTIAGPSTIRPASVVWDREGLYPHKDASSTHYRSDPYTYLEGARTLTSLYMAQWREPLFLFVTKQMLRLFDGKDVAVSFASFAGSMLAIWFTYLLGASVWSRPAGVLAALGIALDFDVVSFASLGWRDDLYMAAFTGCAYLLWRLSRAADGPVRHYRIARWQIDAVYAESVLFGLGAGLAVLTRIMAVPLLIAGVGWIVLTHRRAWRRTIAAAGIAGGVALLTAGPYFVNCWREFGDPLYTFNVHGAIYSAATGNADFHGSTAAYVSQRIASRPFDVLDTVAQGVTTYPFRNKFHGLNPWWPAADIWVAAAALAGFVILAGTATGRLLILTTFTALLPFSLTWTVDPDYRFTMFIYPVQLIAAGVACVTTARLIRRVIAPGLAVATGVWSPFTWRPWVVTVGAVALVTWFAEGLSTRFVFAEALTAGEPAQITAGTRDAGAFGRGWSAVMTSGNVSMRAMTDEAALALRMPAVGDYQATVRMDPFPRPLTDVPARSPVVEFALNGTPIATVPLKFTADRVGAYDIVLPRSAVRPGTNELVLRMIRPADSPAPLTPVRPGLSDGDAIAFWYLRVRPAK